jgi:23S rRNA (guanine745-N1)-methyltransferase
MSIIICPNCKSVLNKNEKTLQCLNGHSFDIAKEGYTNLLLPNQKKSLDPGDNKAMMNARESFLDIGHYDFLIEFIESSLFSFEDKTIDKNRNLIDLGCGTGYYTRKILREQNINKIGVDISKAGISKAAKLDRSSKYIISSIFNLPIEDYSVDIVLNIFSPVSIPEVKRILKPGGYFIKVVPAENHMREIASLVYEKVIPHSSSFETDISNYSEFSVVKTQDLEKSILLTGDDLYNQISMTPYLYKFQDGELEKLKALKVTISFKVIIIQTV